MWRIEQKKSGRATKKILKAFQPLLLRPSLRCSTGSFSRDTLLQPFFEVIKPGIKSLPRPHSTALAISSACLLLINRFHSVPGDANAQNFSSPSISQRILYNSSECKKFIYIMDKKDVRTTTTHRLITR